MKILFLWLVAVNVLTYFVFWLDKRRASKDGRRIPERELLLWSLAGGSLGGLIAMRRLRHKTQKRSFKLWFAGVLLLQAAAIYLALR